MLATRTTPSTSTKIGSTATPTATGGGGTRVPMWEEQIVPTLKKRLESESAYIANRLSATQFDDDNNNNHPSPLSSSSSYVHHPIPPSHPFAPAAGTTPRQYPSPPTSTFPSLIPVHTGYSNRAGSASPPSQSNVRSRTKSGPMPIGLPATGNRHRPSSSRKAGAGAGVGLGIKSENPNPSRQREASVPLPETSDHWQTKTNGTSAFNPNQPPSRIPMRPRSKSQLGPRRPSPTRLSSTPPIPNPSLHSGGSGSNSGPSTPRIPILSRTSSANATTAAAGRTSPDLNAGRMREALVKNELPPFRVLPEEALRIAERGHDLQDEGEENDVYALYGLGDDEGDGKGAKRKRAVTMRGDDDDLGQRLTVRPINSRNNSSGSDRSTTGGRTNARPATAAAAIVGGTDLSRSTTESALGLGHPARRFVGDGNGHNGIGGSKARSSSNRTTNGLSSSTTSSGSFAPRSASLNLLATSSSPNSTPTSRLGVAAHFIPPESNYTPPKGTDWDDVVLPAVAKKLGMTDGERLNNAGLTEEDFAVEWDKDGTPVRWAKRKVGPGRTDESTSTSDTTNDGMGQSRTAFSPSFEPSPDNPMYQPKSSSTSTSTEMRYQRSQEGLGVDLSPIRTTSARSRGLAGGGGGGDEPPSSPAPFSSLAPNPNPNFDQGAPFPSLSRKGSSSGAGGLGRKPSLLRKQPSDISRQESSRSLRNQYQLTSMNQSYIHQQRFGPGPGSSSLGMGMGGTPHTPGTTHGITDAIYANDRARREGSKLKLNSAHAQSHGQRYPAQSQSQSQSQGKGRVDDGTQTHGKGCGCVIM